MSRLKNKLQTKLREAKPFLTVKVFGVENVLVERVENTETGRDDIYPLCVNLIPPSTDFCVNHKILTSFISRYTDLVKPETDAFKANKTQASMDAMIDKTTDKALSRSATDNLQALNELVKLGRSAFMQLAETCYYMHEPNEIEKVRFFEPTSRDTVQEEIDALMAKSDEFIYFPLTNVEEEKFIDLAMQMVSMLGAGASINANIPFVHETVSFDEVSKDIKKETVVSSVEASKSGPVPSKFRSLSPTSLKADGS